MTLTIATFLKIKKLQKLKKHVSTKFKIFFQMLKCFLLQVNLMQVK